MSINPQNGSQPTIVLVHGAFAESASWNDCISKLLALDYPVVAFANPLRGVKSDAAYLASLLQGIQGPVVLAGHSYGGSVITECRHGQPQRSGAGLRRRICSRDGRKCG
jgi:pimeloyl-ACP methyl ester carboxylesterase